MCMARCFARQDSYPEVVGLTSCWRKTFCIPTMIIQELRLFMSQIIITYRRSNCSADGANTSKELGDRINEYVGCTSS